MPKNASDRLRFSYNVQECIRNLLRIQHDFSNRGIRGQVLNSSYFWSQFPIGLRIARTDYGLYDSVIIKIFANWVRLSPRLQIFVNSWDSCPAWNRGIKQYFLHILSLETDKNPSWISGRWRMNVLVYICFHDQSPGNNGLWLGHNGTHEPLMNSWACLRLSYGTQ